MGPRGGMEFVVVSRCHENVDPSQPEMRDEVAFVHFMGKQQKHTKFSATLPSLGPDGEHMRVVANFDADTYKCFSALGRIHHSEPKPSCVKTLATKDGTLESLDFGDRASVKSCKN